MNLIIQIFLFFLVYLLIFKVRNKNAMFFVSLPIGFALLTGGVQIISASIDPMFAARYGFTKPYPLSNLPSEFDLGIGIQALTLWTLNFLAIFSAFYIAIKKPSLPIEQFGMVCNNLKRNDKYGVRVFMRFKNILFSVYLITIIAFFSNQSYFYNGTVLIISYPIAFISSITSFCIYAKINKGENDFLKQNIKYIFFISISLLLLLQFTFVASRGNFVILSVTIFFGYYLSKSSSEINVKKKLDLRDLILYLFFILLAFVIFVGLSLSKYISNASTYEADAIGFYQIDRIIQYSYIIGITSVWDVPQFMFDSVLGRINGLASLYWYLYDTNHSVFLENMSNMWLAYLQPLFLDDNLLKYREINGINVEQWLFFNSTSGGFGGYAIPYFTELIWMTNSSILALVIIFTIVFCLTNILKKISRYLLFFPIILLVAPVILSSESFIVLSRYIFRIIPICSFYIFYIFSSTSFYAGNSKILEN